MPDRPISFLLGAGFSVPAGYPTAAQLNGVFMILKAGQLSIHSDGSAWFHGGNPGPNDWMSLDQRTFVERLLGHYAHRVVTPDAFHYEAFYDWYKALRRGEITDPATEALADDLSSDFGSLLLEFDHTFNQLLAAPLTCWYPEVHHCSGSPPTHARFLELVEWLGDRHSAVQVHTLNHDLFFESLAHSDAMIRGFSDGFVELGSPYYGVVEKPVDGPGGKGYVSYRVRLRYFVDAFDAPFNLYKLHGSVDRYSYRDGGPTTVKSRWGVALTRLKKEVPDKSGQLRYEEDPSNYHPDFLSGTTYKTLLYDSSPYYKAVFERFKHNLEQSKTLVVIGYSFGDRVINTLIEQHLLNRPGTGIVVIDIAQPSMPDAIARRSRYAGGGVSSFDLGVVARPRF